MRSTVHEATLIMQTFLRGDKFAVLQQKGI